MIDSDRIAAIEARCEAATPGPWGTPEKPIIPLLDMPYNAGFIAHAREDMPFLLSQLAAKDAEIERLREAQRWTDTEYDTPDIGQAVLLYMPDKETDNIKAGEYMGEGDYRIGNKLYRGMEIDAWLPLPAAPCGKDGEGE